MLRQSDIPEKMQQAKKVIGIKGPPAKPGGSR